MITLTAEHLKAIVPGIKDNTILAFLAYLNKYMAEAQINTAQRIAAFLAQVLHESGGLKYTREIWGPTAQQKRYERDRRQPWVADNARNALAFALGNTEEGDGAKFKGHGLIQTTGRSNHKKCSIALFGDHRLLKTPELLTTPENAVRSACWYWTSKNLNAKADTPGIQDETKAVNGGLNGITERQAYYNRAIEVLS